MSRLKSTPLIAVILALSLSACASGTSGAALPDAAPSARRAVLAPMCPTPTPGTKLARIEVELDRAIAAKLAPEVLATEWERLDEAARKCRGL